MSKKDILNIVVLIIMVICVGFYLSLNQKNTPIETNHSTQQEYDLKNKSIADELAQKYQAIRGWKEITRYTHTLQAQELLITDTPVLLEGVELSDVFKRGEKYFVRFSDYDYLVELETDKTTLDKMTHQGAVFHVVAKINSVSRPTYVLEAKDREGDEPVPPPDIAVDSSDLRYGFAPLLIKGSLVDFDLIHYQT